MKSAKTLAWETCYPSVFGRRRAFRLSAVTGVTLHRETTHARRRSPKRRHTIANVMLAGAVAGDALQVEDGDATWRADAAGRRATSGGREKRRKPAGAGLRRTYGDQ